MTNASVHYGAFFVGASAFNLGLYNTVTQLESFYENHTALVRPNIAKPAAIIVQNARLAQQEAYESEDGLLRELAKISRAMTDGGVTQAHWEREIQGMLQTPERRESMFTSGLAEREMVAECTEAELCSGCGRGRRVMLRGVYTGLLHQAKKRVESGVAQRTRLPPGETGGRYHCLPPERVMTPGLPSLMGATEDAIAANLASLRTERLVVVDDVLPVTLLQMAQAEARDYEARGQLRGEHKSTCNPGERSCELGLWEARRREQFDGEIPGLMDCVRRMWNLASLLGPALGLHVRVPQVSLLASYPPGALYHPHLDSYDGKDIPRLLTVLLYLNYEPRRGGELRAYLPDGSVRDVAPTPGRLCIFYSQEVEHQVLESVGERHAVTLWIWDVKKDGQGR